jgi:hypothetical protein
VFDICGRKSGGPDGVNDICDMKSRVNARVFDIRSKRFGDLASAPQIARACRGPYPVALPDVAPEQRLLRRVFNVQQEGRTERQFPRPVRGESVGDLYK